MAMGSGSLGFTQEPTGPAVLPLMGETTLPKPSRVRMKGDGRSAFYFNDKDLQEGQGIKALRGLLGGGRKGREMEKVLVWTDRCLMNKIKNCYNPFSVLCVPCFHENKT